jgi:hypothetical protein
MTLFLTEQQAKTMYSVNGWPSLPRDHAGAREFGFDTMTEPRLVAEFEVQRAWAAERPITGDSSAWPLLSFRPVGSADAKAKDVPTAIFRSRAEYVANQSVAVATARR